MLTGTNSSDVWGGGSGRAVLETDETIARADRQVRSLAFIGGLLSILSFRVSPSIQAG
jgi:hypothetical protein